MSSWLLAIDAPGYVLIIAAMFAGLGGLVTSVAGAIILINQSNATRIAAIHKLDTDQKLEVIRVDVNSNLTQVKAQLAAAMDLINSSSGQPPITPHDLPPPKGV